MILSPRYGARPIITIDGNLLDVREPLLRQRRRLESTLARLTQKQWTQPSRCAGWTVKDVVSHLTDVNRFWTRSIRSGVTGKPTRLLATYDAVATPASAVNLVRDRSHDQVLASFVDTNRALADTTVGLDGRSWSATAEAPPGHLSVGVVAHHALWDAWVHERDITIPLGLGTTQEPDEVLACLRYVAGLGPAISIIIDKARTGELIVNVTDPAATIVITIGDAVSVGAGPARAGSRAVHISGAAVDLIEAMSLRTPFTVPIPSEKFWMVQGLAFAFDSNTALISQPVS